MVLDKREIDKERLNGKIIMAIKIIKDQNELAPYVHARCYLIKRIKEKVLYAEENYHFPFDVIKHAMPVQLLDEEKKICENNIENIGIINCMAYEIYESIKLLNE